MGIRENVKKQNRHMASVAWNTIGCGLNAGQAAILLVFISRRFDTGMVGVITISYAIANLLFSVGKYGVRNFQATDREESISFLTYLKARMISVSISLCAIIAFLAFLFMNGCYSWEKCQIVFQIVFMKQVDAFEDVFLGRLQQVNHFEIGARIMALRQIAVTTVICVAIVFGASIQSSLLTGIIVSFLIDIYMLTSKKDLIKDKVRKKTDADSLLYLMGECFPLCVGTTLAIYVGNAPKYIVDMHMNEYTQAVLGYMMLPVFMVTLVNQFIYLPFVKNLGDLWSEHRVQEFKDKVIKQSLFIAVIAVVILCGSIWVGLPLLSALYNIDLSKYYLEFAAILVGGSLYALSSYLNIPITILRKQNFIAFGYGGAAVVSVALGGLLCQRGGMLGIALLYMAINGGLVVIFGILLRSEVR